MSIPYTRHEKLAGLFLLAALVLIFLGAVIVGGGRDWFRSYNTYYALYNDGYGLSPGVKVKFLRTDVGLVTRLELTENNKVKVHMSILSEYAARIKSDSIATVASPTFIGSEYIDIIPGSQFTSPVPKGGQIPAMERKSLEDYIRDLRLDVLLASVEAIMNNVASLTNQLQDHNGPFVGTLSDVRKITASVADGEGTLGKLLSSDVSFEKLDAILSDIRATTDNVAKVSGSLGGSLPSILGRVNTITMQVEEATRTLPRTSRRVDGVLRSTDQILDSVKRNILIRGNITPEPEPETKTYPMRRR